MNLLLLTEDDRLDGERFAVFGRRAEHLLRILQVTPGQTVRVGILDGDVGRGEVLTATASPANVVVRVGRDGWRPGPARSADVLVLAVPRPKVLRRMLAAAAALGFGSIHCTRSWRVDKSHLGSRVLAPAAIAEAVRLGLEQSRRTRPPTVSVHQRFTGCVAALAADLPRARFVGHPGPESDDPEADDGAPGGPTSAAPRPLVDCSLGPGEAFALALGPDGGWLPREVATLQGVGFQAVHFGPWPQRTETALAVLWGQLDLLRQRPPGA